MLERGNVLSQYQLQTPNFDAQFFAGLMRWGMLAIIATGAVWVMYEIFKRFGDSPLVPTNQAEEKLEL